jgi:hypothetical protein
MKAKEFKNFNFNPCKEVVMKRLAVALAAVGLTASLGAYAAMPTGAQATEVNVPQDQGGFFVGASALYWQPTISGSDLDYGVNQSGGNNTYQQINNVNPNYNWGFNVFAGYNFGNGNDVMLEYLRLHTNDSSANTAPAGGYIVPSHYFASNTAKYLQEIDDSTGLNQILYDNYHSAYGKAQINLDQGDLTVGQYLNIGCADQLRFFGGLRYAKLERQLTSNYSQNPNNAGDTNLGTGVTTSTVTVADAGTYTASHGALQNYDDSTFKGIGPLIGLNNTYYLGYGIGFIAGLDTGLLIGNINDSLTLTNYQAATVATGPAALPTGSAANGVENITVTNVSFGSTRRVVPVADAKLGFDYTYPFQNYGSLTLEAGWNVSHYWNVVDGIDAGASDAQLTNAAGTITFANGVTGVTPGHHTNSVGYQGPYVTLTYRATPTA